MHASERFDQPGFEEAVAAFRRSLELDPSFALAAEALALTYGYQAAFGFVPTKEGREQQRAAAQWLSKSTPNPPAPTRCWVVHLTYDWDWPAANRQLTTALALAPHDPDILGTTGMERAAMGNLKNSPVSDTALLLDSA